MQELEETYPKPEVGELGIAFWKEKPASSAWCRLFAAYMLGDRLQSFALKNAVIDHIRKHFFRTQPHKNAPLCAPIRYAFEHTPPKSPLRILLVDIVFWYSSKLYLPSNFRTAQHPDFINSLAYKVVSLSLLHSLFRSRDMLRDGTGPLKAETDDCRRSSKVVQSPGDILRRGPAKENSYRWSRAATHIAQPTMSMKVQVCLCLRMWRRRVPRRRNRSSE